MTSPELSEALELSREGYAIFPLHTARMLQEGQSLCTCGTYGCTGKHPRDQFSKISTGNKQQINKWYNVDREPQYGIGIHLGKSYCWVLDIDGKEGQDDLNGILSEHTPLPKTRLVRSGSGDGFHYYFSGWVDKIHSGSLTENIHIKGNAGNAYVVAPPTIHVSGNRYSYITRMPPMGAPEWLTNLIQTSTSKTSSPLNQEQIQERMSHEVPITRLLTTEHLKGLHQEGTSIRGSHPVHGSKNKRNFCIDIESNRWFCNRDGHVSSGGLFELAAMLAGICKCEDFKRRSPDEITIPSLQGKKFVQAVQFCLDSGINPNDLKKHLSRGKYAAQ